MVAEPLHAVGDEEWLADLNTGRIERLPAEYVGSSGRQWRGDAAWRAWSRRRRPALLRILYNCGSANDPNTTDWPRCLALSV